jgi:hypothetical protein
MPRTKLDLKAEFALMFVWGILHKHVTRCGRMRCVWVWVCVYAWLLICTFAFGDNTCISSHMSLIQKCVGETLFAKMRDTCEQQRNKLQNLDCLVSCCLPVSCLCQAATSVP